MASAKPASPSHNRAWEDLRREARKLESELDVKLAAFAKLCSGLEGGYGKSDSTLPPTEQLAHSKGGEIEDLLGRLSDVNDNLSSALSGAGDARSHTVARHRDILHDFSQEFRRLSAALGAARDRASLFYGASDSTPLLGGTSGPSAGVLLRERTTIQSSTAAMDDVLEQAEAVASHLSHQKRILEGLGSKLISVGSKFPVVNGLLNAIRRKKNKDTLILAGVIATCTIFLLLYIWHKSFA